MCEAGKGAGSWQVGGLLFDPMRKAAESLCSPPLPVSPTDLGRLTFSRENRCGEHVRAARCL